MDMMEYLARSAYNAHEIAMGRVNRGNKPLVNWLEVSEENRGAWQQAALAVLAECAAEVKEMCI